MDEENEAVKNPAELSDSACPMCFKEILNEDLQTHVNRCLFYKASNSSETPQQKKHFTIFEKSPKMPAKKPRLSLSFSAKTPSSSASQPAVIDLSDEEESKKKLKEENVVDASIPLAERVRPSCLDDFIGQTHVLEKNAILRKLLDRNDIPSMILWGPPGCGKTTLSHIVAQKAKATQNTRFVKLSATAAGVNDVKEIVKVAKNEQKFKRRTILFMDEIHRFNKLQQDIFLPHVEAGTITLIGATTENPLFSLNSALLSRCRVIVLEKLKVEDLMKILRRALNEYNGVVIDESGKQEDQLNGDTKLIVDTKTIQWLAEMSDGDARIALNSLQLAVQSIADDPTPIKLLSLDAIKEGIKRSHLLYDRKGDQHFDMISALHKSIRASDDNAALYWCTRMMLGGEDPRYIVRRMIRAASEDVGLADPQAVAVALGALQAVQMVGMPEADIIVAQCAVYLARAPKSREMDNALARCRTSIKEAKGALPPVPLHLRNAPTKLMKELGYGAGYNMAQKEVSGLQYMPEGMEDVNYFN